MREHRELRAKKKWKNLKQTVTLNRMINGPLSHDVNEELLGKIEKLERRFPALARA